MNSLMTFLIVGVLIVPTSAMGQSDSMIQLVSAYRTYIGISHACRDLPHQQLKSSRARKDMIRFVASLKGSTLAKAILKVDEFVLETLKTNRSVALQKHWNAKGMKEIQKALDCTSRIDDARHKVNVAKASLTNP